MSETKTKTLEEMTDSEILKKIHSQNQRHVIHFETDVSEDDRRRIIHTSNLLLQFRNEIVRHFQKNLNRLKHSSVYRDLQRKYGDYSEKIKKVSRKIVSVEKELKTIKDADKISKAETLLTELRDTVEQLKTERSMIGGRMSDMQKEEELTKTGCEKFARDLRNHKYSHISSDITQKKADEVWNGIDKVLHGKGKRLHTKKNIYPEISPKKISTGILLKINESGQLFMEMTSVGAKGQKAVLTPKIKENDRFLKEELASVVTYLQYKERIEEWLVEEYRNGRTHQDQRYLRPCFASVQCEEIRGKIRVFMNLTVEGIPRQKLGKDGKPRHTYGKGDTGMDVGPQQIAVASGKETFIWNLAGIGMTPEEAYKKMAAILHAMDRSRRATNPDNYNADGTVKKGRKKWKYSAHYKELRTKLRTLTRTMKVNRKYSANRLANHIRSLGDRLITEKKETTSWARRSKKTERQEKVSEVKKKNGETVQVQKCKKKKRMGKSILNRCPGYLQSRVEQIFLSTGGEYMEVDTGYRASQYDHTSDTYIKKQLSDRTFCLSDGTFVQRDMYSAFLLMCSDQQGKRPDREKCIQRFEKQYEDMKEMMDYIIRNGIDVKNCGLKKKHMEYIR